jgi:hypothetical protein
MIANNSAKDAAKPKKRARGRPRGGEKIAVTIMLPTSTKDRLDAIAEQTGVNRGAFVDQALQAHFKKSRERNP